MDSESGIHWFSWQRMPSGKDMGGLGFRLLKEFNVALVAK